jgi:endonuclease/exonuclease/phosphatase (EEP) superfamily protein YafD
MRTLSSRNAGGNDGRAETEGVDVILSTWNLNNRVGKVRFRLDAAAAVASLGADVLVLTEFYPAGREVEFLQRLSAAGWRHQLIQPAPAVRANRVLIASRVPLSTLDLERPQFDEQFPANIHGARLPNGIAVVGLRVPAYGWKERGLLEGAWDWIECTAARLADGPAVIVGDFNTSEYARSSPARKRFRALLESGWQRAVPHGSASYFSPKGLTSEIDHVLFTRSCVVKDARYVLEASGFRLAGAPEALSDHAALSCTVGLASAQE